MKDIIESIRKNPKGYLKQHASVFGNDLDTLPDELLLGLMYASATFDATHYFRRIDKTLIKRPHLLEDPLKAYYYYKFKGLLARSLSQSADALSHFTLAYENAIIINDPELIVRMLSFIATAFDQLGDAESAFSYAQKSIQMIPKLTSKSLIAELYMNYATILKHNGKEDACFQAYQYAELAFNDVADHQEYLNYCILLINIGGVFLNKNMNQLSDHYVSLALSIAEKNDFLPYLQSSIKVISDYYLKKGDLAQSNKVLNLYLESHLHSTQNSDLKAMRLQEHTTLTKLNTLHHLHQTNQHLTYELAQLKKIMVTEDEHAIARGLKLSEISEGMRQDAFSPYLQAKYAIHSGHITGAEILARWVKPNGDVIGPNAFISLIENNDLVFDFSERLLRKALTHLAPIMRTSFPTFKVAINISPYQLAHQDVVGLLESCCVEYGLLPLNLEIEIIERTFIENDPRAIQQLFTLKDKGFSISLDDFGSGYSSLACLVALPLDIVKIDKSLVDGIDKSPKSRRLFTSLVLMLSELNIDTIAEGVETLDQLKRIKETSCSEGQGYLFQKPVSYSDFSFENLPAIK